MTVKTLGEPCKFRKDDFRRSRSVSRFNLQAFVHGCQGLFSAFKILRRYWSGTGGSGRNALKLPVFVKKTVVSGHSTFSIAISLGRFDTPCHDEQQHEGRTERLCWRVPL